ncbi:MAG: ATPase, T2SS/T4P/T4SS family [Candidatus Acidiferrales bacterium]
MTAPPFTDSAARLTATPPLPPTNELIALLVKSVEKVSDIFLSPMRAPQVRVNGRIISPLFTELPELLPDDTRRIANDLIGNRPSVQPRLNAEGSCDFSFFVPKLGRFRVNIFSQRGSYAIKLRVISDPVLPTFESLHLPPQLEQFASLRSGLVVFSGAVGSGKSSTLTAVLGRISEQRDGHIITVEDPVEFQFRHRKATVLQRELYRDVPSFPIALRASLRHPPHVIFLSTLPDRETLDLALEAADCGHLVFAALHTPDASRTVGHLLRFFSPAEESTTRQRLARTLRGIVSQRLLPRLESPEQVALFEILFSTPRIRECIATGEQNVMSLTDAIREGASQNMQCFEDELKKLQKAGVIAADLDWEEIFGDWIPAHARPLDPRNPVTRPEIEFAHDPK